MKQQLPPAAAIQILADLLRRTPMTVAEQVGAQAAIDRLEELTSPANETPKPEVPPAN